MKKSLCILFCFLLLWGSTACAKPAENTIPTATAPLPTDPTAPTATEPAIPSECMEISHPVTGESMVLLREYARIFELNPDLVGWIQIPNTVIDYPVMQTPDSPNYYLNHNFQKEEFRAGSIYAFERADITNSLNVTLYGHNMGNGSMFAGLHNYRNKDFYEANPYITFDSLYANRTYEIFAVFEINIKTDSFRYHSFTHGDAVAFDNFVANCRKRSLYDTGVEVSYGDKLLTLSTCDQNYYTDTGRFVVVAKLVS